MMESIRMYYANEGKRLIDTYTNHVSGDKDEYGIWSVYES